MTGDAGDMAMGIGPEDALRFIGMNLLDELKREGLSEDAIYKRIPPGRTVMDRTQLTK